jgi:hypothetical protein
LWRGDAGVHVNDELVGEAFLTRVKEVLEVVFEVLEKKANEFGLHCVGELFVEFELLDDQVEVKAEGIVDVASDVPVEAW